MIEGIIGVTGAIFLAVCGAIWFFSYYHRKEYIHSIKVNVQSVVLSALFIFLCVLLFRVAIILKHANEALVILRYDYTQGYKIQGAYNNLSDILRNFEWELYSYMVIFAILVIILFVADVCAGLPPKPETATQIRAAND